MPPLQHADRGAGSPTGGPSKLGELLDRLSETVFEFDVTGKFVYVNRAGLEVFGYTPEDVARGVSVFDVVLPGDGDRLRNNFDRRLAGDDTDGFEYTARRKDGSTFPALVQTTLVRQGGAPVGVQGYLVDISQRVRTEAALRHRIELEKLIMRLSTRLVTEAATRELDASIDHALAEIGRFMAVDRSYVFLIAPDGNTMDNTHEWVAEGVSSERANLQHVPADSERSWFMRELRARHTVPVPRVADLPSAAQHEQRELERQGIRSMLCVALVHDGGVGGLLGLDAVHEERTWSEDEIGLLRIVGELLMGAIARRRAELALHESEAKYRALVENTATGFVIVDAEGRVLDANAEYVRMAGYRQLDELRGRSVLAWIAPHDRERATAALQACLAHGSARNLQVDYCHADGTLVPVLVSATVSGSAGGRQVVAITRDMTEHVRLETELLRSEKLRSVGVLAGGIAHDFNNILTAILGNVSLLQNRLGPHDDNGTYLDEVERATLRARELTRQLLTFSHGGEPVRKLFDLTALLRESATLALRGRATGCTFDLAADLPAVDGDEGQLGQVVRNLVLNASQAMGGGGSVAIAARARTLGEREISLLPAGNYLAVTVEDAGTGISDDHLPRIFDPYFTTKTDGSGLGLAISHSIVANHAGAITVDSQPGHGARFTVFLPAAVTRPQAPPPPHPAIVHGRGRVLIMDDEEAVRTVAGKIVEVLGYEAAFARDGEEALAAWHEARERGVPFDVAIMDLTVPGRMGGREATLRLLALEPEAKVVVSSGYSDDPVMASFREHGFRDVLAKPYRVADVSAVLSSLMGA